MDPKRAGQWLLAVIYLAFVSLGLPDGTFGVAWPAMYPELGLPLGLGGSITSVVTLLSGASGFCSGWILARVSPGPVVFASGLLTGGALLSLVWAPGYAAVLAAAVPLGFGAGAVDAALNGYVARHYRGRHMNWLHACWGVGATCGPLLMGQAIAGAGGWRGGYALLGALQLGLALLIAATLRLWSRVPERHDLQDTPGGGRAPALGADSAAGRLSPVLFALYAALEASVGLWTASLLILGRGFSPAAAAVATAVFYGAITGGRVLAGYGVERWGNRRTVRWGAALAVAGLPLLALPAGPALAMLGLACAGLGFAPIYPGLMQEVPRRFAATAAQTVIGRQTGAAYFGVALLPAAAGGLAQNALALLPWAVFAGALLLWLGIRQLDRMTPAE